MSKTEKNSFWGNIQSVNENLQMITNAGENVSGETKEVMKSVVFLQDMVEQFHL